MEDIDNIVVDDSDLLADRLVRSLHRNPDGHLSASQQQHKDSVEITHNVAVLYIYTVDAGEYMLHEHYVYSDEPLSYNAWVDVVNDECLRLTENADKSFVGVHGWTTAHLKITPLRTGDLFIKIDIDGARGVRLTFDSAKTERKTRKGSKHG
jgi:hypothetical protein